MRVRLPGTTLILGLALAASEAPAQEWQPARPDFSWSFPRDHWSHPGFKTEWWYFTGHLAGTADSSPRFGYQFTFFRVGLNPDSLALESSWAVTDLIMGHAAVTDLATGEHRFAELVWRANGFLGAFAAPLDTMVAWSRAPAGTNDTWTLRWREGGFAFRARDDRRGFAFDLSAAPVKPRVFQGPNGYSKKGAADGAASLYYSHTRLATVGTLVLDGREYAVTGESWMDKEFGSNQLTAAQVGWDWLSLRLDDGRDVMVYLLRDGTGRIDHTSATLVSPLGDVRYLADGEWSFEPAGTLRSTRSGASYPAEWRLTLPTAGLSLRIVPDVVHQENVSRLIPSLYYWEGSVTALDGAGERVGRGYVEMTGYGDAVKLAL